MGNKKNSSRKVFGENLEGKTGYGRKYFKVSFLKKDIGSVAIGCMAIWIICSMSEKYISSVLISTLFSVSASVISYMIVLLIMKNQAVKLILDMLHIKN